MTTSERVVGTETTDKTAEARTPRLAWLTRQRDTAIGAGAVLVAAFPMLVTALTTALRRPDLLPWGDQASNELASSRAGHLTQLLGPYSRYGWHHPGPAWFYLTAAVTRPFHDTSWSVYVAVLTLQGLAAALIVACAWRRAGPAVAALTSLLVLLFVRAVGESVLRYPWNPYATILPMALLFLLAAGGALGSSASLIGALLAGSFLVQTHLSTTPTVVAVLVATLVLRFALARRGSVDVATVRRGGRLAGAGLLLLVLTWLPTLLDQLHDTPGNIRLLYDFFRHGGGGAHPLRVALAELARQLAIFPFGHTPTPIESAIELTTGRALIDLGFIVAAVGLVVASIVLRNRFSGLLGALLLVAVPAAVVSMMRADGPLVAFLVAWVSALTLVLAIGWIALLVNARPWERTSAARARLDRLPRRSTSLVAAGVLALALVGLSASRAVAFSRLPAEATDAPPTVPQIWQQTAAALAVAPGQPVLVKIADPAVWPFAAVDVLQLTKRGTPVAVTDDWLYIFGTAERTSGGERIELIVVVPADAAAVARLPGVAEVGRTVDAVTFARPLPPGAVDAGGGACRRSGVPGPVC